MHDDKCKGSVTINIFKESKVAVNIFDECKKKKHDCDEEEE